MLVADAGEYKDEEESPQWWMVVMVEVVVGVEVVYVTGGNKEVSGV